MKCLQTATLLLLSAYQALAAFNAKTDSCTPIEGTYQGVLSPDYVACKVIGATRLALYECPGRGKVAYDYIDNTVHVSSAARPVDGEFTIHGSCVRDHSTVIATMDLFTPTRASAVINHTYPGLAKLCRIKDAGVRLYFTAYVLNLRQLGQCSLHPVKPIS